MDDIKKPILYNGYEISEGISVNRRIAYEFFTDVYELSNGEILYLFTKITPQDVKNQKTDTFTISVGQDVFLCAKAKQYSKSSLSKLMDSLTELRGFDAVAGMDELKQILLKDVIGPLKNPEKYKEFKVPIPNGLLLFGPPGCGKTFIIRKLAEEIGYNFVEVKHSDITSSYIHGTVDKVKRTFEIARAKAPSIVFIDEIDGLIPRRDSLSMSQDYKQEEINEFLMQFNDAGKQNILIVAATNQPQLLDPALLRPGRMDVQVYVSPPDKEARKELFEMFLDERPLGDVDFDYIAEITPNYASVDIEYIANEAARITLVEGGSEITQDTIVDVIRRTPPSISQEELNKYEQYRARQRV